MDTVNDTRDGGSVRDFLRRRFPTLERGERIEIRALDRNAGGAMRARGFFATPEEAADYAMSLDPGWEIYYGINPRLGEDGTKKGIARILCLWGDLDYKKFGASAEATRAALDAFPLEPTWIVATGGGLHAYWLIEPLDAAEHGPTVERLLRALYAALGNIDSVQNVDRIFRLPGSCNNKYGEPRRVRVVRHTPSARYTLHQFERALPALPPGAIERGETVPTEPGGMSVEEVESLLAHIPPTLPYNEYLAVWMAVHSVFPGDDGREIIDRWSSDAREANGQTCSPRTQPGKHRGFRRSGEHGAVGAGTLVWYATQHGYTPPTRPVPQLRRRVDTMAPVDQGSGEPLQWSPPLPLDRMAAPPPFPLDDLPETLRAWVAAEALATQTPPDLAAMVALAAIAAATAKRAVVEVRPGWREPLNLYAVVALPPANRKSAVFRDATAPLFGHERELVERMRPAILEAESRRRRKEAELKQAEAAAAKAATANAQREAELRADRLARELDEVAVPASPRLVADDVTPEKLKGLLAEQGGRMAILSAEGGPFEVMAGRYSRNGAPNFEVYLKGHGGDEIIVDRSGRAGERVAEPALTLGLAVQPAVLRRLAADPSFRGQGLLARLLYSVPESRVGRRDIDAPPVPQGVQARYGDTLAALLALPMPERPHVLRLATLAQERFRLFERWLEPRLAEHGDLGGVADWGGKLAGAVARIAGLLHGWQFARGCPRPWDIPIDRQTIEAAIAVGEYLIGHAGRAFAAMAADPVLADAGYILRWIAQRRPVAFTKRDIFEGTKGRFGRVDDLAPGLALLVSHEYLRPREAGRSGGPGRPPSPTYEVNPYLYSQNSRYSQN